MKSILILFFLNKIPYEKNQFTLELKIVNFFFIKTISLMLSTMLLKV